MLFLESGIVCAIFSLFSWQESVKLKPAEFLFMLLEATVFLLVRSLPANFMVARISQITKSVLFCLFVNLWPSIFDPVQKGVT
jgi:hypothetical protein